MCGGPVFRGVWGKCLVYGGRQMSRECTMAIPVQRVAIPMIRWIVGKAFRFPLAVPLSRCRRTQRVGVGPVRTANCPVTNEQATGSICQRFRRQFAALQDRRHTIKNGALFGLCLRSHIAKRRHRLRRSGNPVQTSPSGVGGDSGKTTTTRRRTATIRRKKLSTLRIEDLHIVFENNASKPGPTDYICVDVFANCLTDPGSSCSIRIPLQQGKP